MIPFPGAFVLYFVHNSSTFSCGDMSCFFLLERGGGGGNSGRGGGGGRRGRLVADIVRLLRLRG